MRIYILGICGTFMGGIAVIAKAAGHQVSGCDANVYPPMSTQLQALGIRLTEGYDPSRLEPADVYVIGNVLSRGNALIEEILNRGLPYISGPQWLGENVLYRFHSLNGSAVDGNNARWTLAVAGTHGKTTTASMLAWILECAKLNPSFLIGGVPIDFGVSARLTSSPYFVVEADEYDTAFFDKRSKFVHYRPRTVILNNIEFDHADIFADLAAIEIQFQHFVRTVPSRGRIVANGAEAGMQRVIDRGCWSELEWFDREGEWEIEPNGDVRWRSQRLGRLEFGLLGRHNQLNALAAIAAARHVGVCVSDSITALKAFKGIKRRLEVRGSVNGIVVYDDFAHHPTAIATTLAGLRAEVKAQRIIAVLEPRSNTMKVGAMKDRLAQSLAEADVVFCYANGVSWNVTEVLSPLGNRAYVHTSLAALVDQIVQVARSGDHIVVMSNGGFGGIHEKLLHELQ